MSCYPGTTTLGSTSAWGCVAHFLFPGVRNNCKKAKIRKKKEKNKKTDLFSFEMLWSVFTLFPAAVLAEWQIIAKKIGGGPLGVACYEDGLTCITSVSQILPAGYEAKRSTDGGVTWATVPDQDLFIFALYNQAVYGEYAVISGSEFIQKSDNKGLNFSAVPGSLAIGGGSIVRKLFGSAGVPTGFAILGLTDDGNTNGLVVSQNNVAGPWTEINIGELKAGVIATDGAFLTDAWIVVGEEYTTGGSQHSKQRRESPTKAVYATQVVRSIDKGKTWDTLYYNKSVATLGLACVDALHCCLVQEDADYAYIQCTMDGFKTVNTTLIDDTEGASLVEASVDSNLCYVVIGGAVTGGGQSPISYHSCDKGISWSLDTLSGFPYNLLFTDVDCLQSGCWATLWDNSGIDPNGKLFFPSPEVYSQLFALFIHKT